MRIPNAAGEPPFGYQDELAPPPPNEPPPPPQLVLLELELLEL